MASRLTPGTLWRFKRTDDVLIVPDIGAANHAFLFSA